MSGGGIKYAQNLSASSMRNKRVDHKLLSVASKIRRGYYMEEADWEVRVEIAEFLEEIAYKIERVSSWEDDYDEDDLNKVLKKDGVSDALKAIDYKTAGDYGTETTVEKFKQADPEL